MIYSKSIFLITLFFSFLLSNNSFNKKISDYNIYLGNPHNLVTSSDFLTYEIITPLFSDYAFKHRAIFIPKGKKVKYYNKKVFDFPVGTIISKTFYYPFDFNDLSKGISLKETRIMIHLDDGWIGLPYVWNEEETEAYLEVTGGILDANWIDIDNQKESIKYIVPNMNQCKGCHINGGVFKPIGPTARQLNMNIDHNNLIQNQIEIWEKLNILDTNVNKEDIPKIAKWNDPNSGSINERARAWLDINCAHCHNLNGPANNTGLYLDYYETDTKALGIYKTPVAAGRGSGKFKYDIVPGYPEKSILVYRFNSIDPGIMMPELGRTMVHKEGLQLIEEWILSLE